MARPCSRSARGRVRRRSAVARQRPPATPSHADHASLVAGGSGWCGACAGHGAGSSSSQGWPAWRRCRRWWERCPPAPGEVPPADLAAAIMGSDHPYSGYLESTGAARVARRRGAGGAAVGAVEDPGVVVGTVGVAGRPAEPHRRDRHLRRRHRAPGPGTPSAAGCRASTASPYPPAAPGRRPAARAGPAPPGRRRTRRAAAARRGTRRPGGPCPACGSCRRRPCRHHRPRRHLGRPRHRRRPARQRGARDSSGKPAFESQFLDVSRSPPSRPLVTSPTAGPDNIRNRPAPGRPRPAGGRASPVHAARTRWAGSPRRRPEPAPSPRTAPASTSWACWRVPAASPRAGLPGHHPTRRPAVGRPGPRGVDRRSSTPWRFNVDGIAYVVAGRRHGGRARPHRRHPRPDRARSP